MSGGKSQRGQAIILLSVALPVLLAMVGLAFDVGFLEMRNRQAQTAADAAAFAGAVALPYGYMTTNADQASAKNGFTNGSNNTTVTVNNPPSLGPHNGSCTTTPNNCNFVEAIVQQSEPTFFLRMIGAPATSTVAARAVAYNTAGDCIFGLGTSGTVLQVIFGIIDTPNCGVVADSNLVVIIGEIDANFIGVVGSATCFGICTPTPVTGIAGEGDPLAYLPVPSTSTCTITDLTITSGTTTVNPATHCYNVSITGNATVTFMPGEYSAINISSTAGSTVTFQAGLYKIVGANGFSIAGTGNTVNATSGVTYYMGPSAGSVSIGGIGNFLNLVAPTTGTYAAILFFQDRANATSACLGGCNGSVSAILNFTRIQGADYFPDANVTFSGCCQYTVGNSYYTAYEIAVAKSVSLSVNWFNDDYSSLPGGSPVKKTLMTE